MVTNIPGRLTNWAGNVTFRAARVHHPARLAELQRLVASSSRLRALGTGHSFSRIADTDGDLVLLDRLPPTIEIDSGRREVTVAAGVRYAELTTAVQTAGLALHNLGSLPHISVAGACATGTHGSGDTLGNLATAVVGLQMITAAGDLVRLRREHDPDFAGAVVALGCLGVVVDLTLRLEPSYEVEQHVYDDLPLAELDDAVFSSAYSVSAVTGPDPRVVRQVWRKRRVDAAQGAAERSWRGTTLADGPRHLTAGQPPENCTEQGGVPGPWHERLPHFRQGFRPSAGEELQSEYLVPRAHGAAALAAVAGLANLVSPVLLGGEIRTVAADDLWLSPCYQRDSLALHFTWAPDTAGVLAVLPEVERALAPYDARPHWGKVFTTDPAVVRGLFPRMADFARLRGQYDPEGVFRNAFTDAYLGAAEPATGPSF